MLQLTEQQKMIRREISRLARDKIAPRAAGIDDSQEYPWDIFDLLSENVILNMCIPEEYGGAGADLTSILLVIEEIAKFSGAIAISFATHTTAVMYLLAEGNAEQKARYLPKLGEEKTVMGFALTEPNAGSDVSSIETKAILCQGHYVIGGVKNFSTNGGVAKLFVVFVVTGGEGEERGISALIVPRDTPGFRVGKEERKLGMRGSSTTELIFEDARVPRENLLGVEGTAFKNIMKLFTKSRLFVAAMALGIAQGALDCAISYAKQRVQFGKPIATLQGVQFMLADMALETTAARQLIYSTATLIDKGLAETELPMLAAMSKCFASDIAMRVTTDAVQVLGGYGCLQDYPVERMMRDAKITQIIEGTNQIQRVIIARNLLR